MSRSYRRTPAFPNCDSSGGKEYKQRAHRRYRIAAKRAMLNGSMLPSEKPYGDIWNDPRDGKFYWSDPKNGWNRK